MKINILIPTYNRAHFVRLQILNMLNIRSALSEIDIDLEVIISDNHSTPAVEVPESYQDFITLIKPPTHLNSGEENVIFALGHCDGEYIWTLGDDDAPIQNNAVGLFKRILEQKPDFIVAGSSAFLNDGSIVQSQTFCSDAKQIKNLPDFVARTGIWFVLTGFSGLIVRRAMVQSNIERFQKYFSASKIYSYAMFLLETFWDGQFMFFNQPIVLAAQNIYGDNWYRMAVMEKVFHRFFWTTGFIRQLKLLRQARSVPLGYYASIIDQRVNSRFPLIYQICSDALGQLREDLNARKYPSRAMNQEEFDEIVQFLCQEEPRFMLLLAPLIKNRDKSFLNQKLIHQTSLQLRVFIDKFFSSYYVKTHCGWNIYYIDSLYRAIPVGAEMSLLSALSDIAPVPYEWQPLAGDLGELEHKLNATPYPIFPSTHKIVHTVLPFRRRLARAVSVTMRSIALKTYYSHLGFKIINILPESVVTLFGRKLI
jgi:hypothetical protein